MGGQAALYAALPVRWREQLVLLRETPLPPRVAALADGRCVARLRHCARVQEYRFGGDGRDGVAEGQADGSLASRRHALPPMRPHFLLQ